MCGVTNASNVDVILSEAKQREKEYDWLGATELYGNVLNLLPENDFSRLGQIGECLGNALCRAAMQAKSQEQFRERMQRAIDAYGKAHEFYGRLIDKQKPGQMLRCEAAVKYLGFWLSPVPSEKRKFLDECLDLVKDALTVFRDSGSKLEFSRTYNEFPPVFMFRVFLGGEWKTVKSIIERGIEWGEKAVEMLSDVYDTHEIAKTYVTLAICWGLLGLCAIEGLEEQEKNRLKIVKSLSQVVGLSENAGDAYLLGWANYLLGDNTGGEEALKHFEKTLECGKLARDNFLIGQGLNSLAYETDWEAAATEEPDKRRELLERCMQLYDEAQHCYSIMSLMSPFSAGSMTTPAGYAQIYKSMALFETDLEKKLILLEKSEKTGIEALKAAEDSEVTSAIIATLHIHSGTLLARARLETDAGEKRSRLEKALKYQEREIKMFGQLAPFSYWNAGVGHGQFAGIKQELANIEPDPDSKRRLLEESVSSEEKCLSLCNRTIPYSEKMGDLNPFVSLRQMQDRLATLLIGLYDLTSKPEQLRKAIDISQKAIESAGKLGLVSLMAESYWKIARAQDSLEEYLEAAKSFENACEDYGKAAEKIPQLKDFYGAQASYMRAWSEIEKARHHHARQEYGSAEEHFEKAADLHKALKQWSYLAPNYGAWAQLEKGEDLSRKEQDEEARASFEHAARLFDETKTSIQSKFDKIENTDEKRMATNMLDATELRYEYCKARIAVEEAKMLDKKGDHYSSSKKYGSAAETFQRISQRQESEQEKREIQFIAALSRAWQKMTLAEAEASPTLYAEAAEVFEQARDCTRNEKTKMLVLGHSRFCKALEAGTKFADTRDQALHDVAVQNLASASNYYIRADFQPASEYAKATKLLFDAYVYMDNAEKEKDPDKKAKLYVMIERVLQTAAGSYTKAEHPEKREQILKLLEKAKEEQELAASMTEALHAPSIVSATTAFASPTPTQEEAVGSERFEHADIQANLIIRQKNLNIGESLVLEIELVNAGKGPALLIKVNEVIPEGFELIEKPETYRVEDSYLNMKGKRLDPLKAEELKLILKPRVQGTFRLKPTILYLDENGKYKSHEPEPITITVKELGIKGWLKGEK
jgi:hypothetical protein